MHSVSTNKAPAPGGHYSQAVRAGQFLFISGQLPITVDGTLLKGSAAEQTTQTMKNIEAIVREAGGSLENLAQVTVYITSVDYWPEVNSAYKECLGETQVPPARAVVPVKELHYGALIEIQATAYLP